MGEKKVILITGVSNYWGSQVAKKLLEESNNQAGYLSVLGLDAQIPDADNMGLDFIQADLRNPLIVELLKSENVHTVCHLALFEDIRSSESSFDQNVIGTMKLLGACSEAGVRKVILRSSMRVYGAKPDNPAFLTEEHPIQGSRNYGYNKDLMEIESFCKNFCQQVPGMDLTILRFSNIVARNVDTPMTHFLTQPFSPVLLGFDPLMQVIHEQDVVNALVHVILKDFPGVYNIAAEGILPLSRLIALATKFPIPVFHLFAYWGSELSFSMGLRSGEFFPIEFDYLRYPWVGDLKKMREELKFIPQHTAEESVRKFANEHKLCRNEERSLSLDYDEERLLEILERRRLTRENAFISDDAEGGTE